MTAPADKQVMAARIKQSVAALNTRCTEAAKMGLIVELDKIGMDIIGGNPVQLFNAKIMERIG